MVDKNGKVLTFLANGLNMIGIVTVLKHTLDRRPLLAMRFDNIVLLFNQLSIYLT